MTVLTQHGYLVIADISGYTSYLSKVELDHAQAILSELMATIVDQFKQVLTISKLEGDAVFANIDEILLPGGEILLELIENTYLAFRRQRDNSQRLTTCTCRACQAIPTLDLKFFVHFGDYIVQDISGIRELVGSDVNLVHRLTKNHIAENTGWHAYILFTKKALELMHLQLEGLHEQIESYEHLGEISTLSMDIHPRYAELAAAKHVIITPEQADYRLEFDFDTPPPVIWDWITNVDLRSKASGGHNHWSVALRPNGRSGVGAKNHCVHGRGTNDETVLDWHPFESLTNQIVDGKIEYQSMYLFTPLDEGRHTRLELRMKLLKPEPLWFSRIMMKNQFKKEDPYLPWFESIRSLLDKVPPS